MIKNRSHLARTDRHEHVLRSLEAGIEAAHPKTVLETAIEVDGETLRVANTEYDLDGVENIYVVGGGNAGGQAATTLESIFGGAIDDGVIVTDDPVETDVIEIVEGTHPLPSEANVAGTQKLLQLADHADEDDLVLVVISGGGSALMCAPKTELTLEDYRDVTDQLLRAGATITEINAIRKHLSTFKGGQLARSLAPAATVGVIFSDVIGNPLDVIASGPTAPDPSTYETSQAVSNRYDLALPETVDRIVREGVAGERRETPDVGDPVFDTVTNHVLADGRTALEASTRSLREDGYAAIVLSSQIAGEASDVGTVHVGIAIECLEAGEPFEPPIALLSGGEATVTVQGDGRGGPNQEFALSAAVGIRDAELLVGAIDTDGIDGAVDVAGAIVDETTVPESRSERARAALDRNDAYGYLDDCGHLIETGPTGTNVNDLRVVVIGKP